MVTFICRPVVTYSTPCSDIMITCGYESNAITTSRVAVVVRGGDQSFCILALRDSGTNFNVINSRNARDSTMLSQSAPVDSGNTNGSAFRSHIVNEDPLNSADGMSMEIVEDVVLLAPFKSVDSLGFRWVLKHPLAFDKTNPNDIKPLLATEWNNDNLYRGVWGLNNSVLFHPEDAKCAKNHVFHPLCIPSFR